jgi:hypothetical protein
MNHFSLRQLDLAAAVLAICVMFVPWLLYGMAK